MSSSTNFNDAAPASLDCYQRITDVDVGSLKETIAKKRPGKGRPIFQTNENGRRVFVRLGNWQFPNILSAKSDERNAALRQLVSVMTPFHYSDVDKEDPTKFKDSALVLVAGVPKEEIARLKEIHEHNIDSCFANQKEIFGTNANPDPNFSREVVAGKVMPLVQMNNGVECVRVKMHFPSRDPAVVSTRTTDVYKQTSALREYEKSTIQQIHVNDLMVAGCVLSGMTVVAGGNVVTTLDAVQVAVAFSDPSALAREPTALFGAGMTLAAGSSSAMDDQSVVGGSGDAMDADRVGDDSTYLGNINA